LDTLKEISADKDEREIYYLRQHTEFGYLSEKNVAVQKAKAEGEQLGAEKERAKAEKEKKAEKIESAKRALSMGLSVEQVSKITGLSLDEVRKL